MYNDLYLRGIFKTVVENGVRKSTFKILGVASLDKRINKLHMFRHELVNKMFIISPQNNSNLREYFLLDRNEKVLGKIKKSSSKSGWWEFNSFR